MDVIFSALQWGSKWVILTTPTSQWQHSDGWPNKQPYVWPAWYQDFNEFWLVEFILLSNCALYFTEIQCFCFNSWYNTQFSGSCWENTATHIFPKKRDEPKYTFLMQMLDCEILRLSQKGVDWVSLGPGSVSKSGMQRHSHLPGTLPLLTQKRWNCAMTCSVFRVLGSLRPVLTT